MDLSHLFFSTEGRINRAKWWLGALSVAAFLIVLGVTLLLTLLDIMFLTFSGRLMMFVPNALALYLAYCLNAKRFQDRGRPKSLAQIMLAIGGTKAVLDLFRVTGDPWAQNFGDTLFMIAFMGVGIWYLIELGCLRGTVGDNQYGSDPLANRSSAA